jgi:hypothetical protein
VLKILSNILSIFYSTIPQPIRQQMQKFPFLKLLLSGIADKKEAGRQAMGKKLQNFSLFFFFSALSFFIIVIIVIASHFPVIYPF